MSKYIKEMEEEDRKDKKGESKHADLLEEKVKKLLKSKDEYSEI